VPRGLKQFLFTFSYREKSFSDELLDLFGNTSTVPSLKPAAPAFSGGINNDFSSLFGSKPDSPATAAKRSHVASPLPQSSSNVSLNNLLIESCTFLNETLYSCSDFNVVQVT